MIESVSRQIVLTGVSRGIGLALATEFIALGHTVHGCARSAQGADELQRNWPSPHTFRVVDVSDEGQVERWAAELLSAGVVPDLLINNAAVINRNAPLWQVPADEITSVMRVNVEGTAHVLRHFLPTMVERASGIVINLSSGWGRVVDAEVAPYCASKWAIEGLSKALAEELPAGMASIPLSPGMVDTDMLRSCFGSNADHYPQPDAWAQKAASYILSLGPDQTGQSLSVPR